MPHDLHPVLPGIAGLVMYLTFTKKNSQFACIKDSHDLTKQAKSIYLMLSACFYFIILRIHQSLGINRYERIMKGKYLRKSAGR